MVLIINALAYPVNSNFRYKSAYIYIYKLEYLYIYN